jgi:hypothetical protein
VGNGSPYTAAEVRNHLTQAYSREAREPSTNGLPPGTRYDADGNVVDENGRIARAVMPPKYMPDEYEDRVIDYIDKLATLPAEMEYLTATRGLTPATIAGAEIGYHARWKRFAFPIRDRSGRLLNIRYYSRTAEPKWLNSKGYGSTQIYGDELLDAASFVLIVAGESTRSPEGSC